MKILITGGGGFIGSQLAKALVEAGELRLDTGAVAVERLILADLAIPDMVKERFAGVADFVEGDFSEPEALDRALPETGELAVFHLASIVSGEAERDFDLAMRVNLDGTRFLLERLRLRAVRRGQPDRLVFASSLAAFGGAVMPPVVSDATKLLPQSTYGMTKVVGELWIQDYSRKGFLDGRSARLPTIFIRPGLPNAAASSFASSMFREPLHGETCELPVAMDQEVPLLGYPKVVECLLNLMELDGGRLGDDRTLTLPSVRYRVSAMIEVLREVAAARGIELGEIREVPDEKVRALVEGWPVGTDAARAESLGMRADGSLREVIERFIADFM